MLEINIGIRNNGNIEIYRKLTVVENPENINKENDLPFIDSGLLINSDKFNGLESQDAKGKISKYCNDNHIGEEVTSYRLRDWGISRQRYWGCPIPIAYDENDNIIKIPQTLSLYIK